MGTVPLAVSVTTSVQVFVPPPLQLTGGVNPAILVPFVPVKVYVTVPVGVKGLAVTVAVSCTFSPRVPRVSAGVLASTMVVDVLELPLLIVNGSTGLVEPP